MSAWRRPAATLAALLAAVLPGIPSGAPARAPVPAIVPAVVPAMVPAMVRASAAPPVPCPFVKPPKKLKKHPPRPVPPAADPALRAIGGEALATAGLAVPPGASRPPAVSARSWVVADLDTGAVLGACGAHEYATPASVQKLLLAAAVMPHLNPNRVVTVTRADLAFEPGSSAVGLLLGGRYAVGTLWLGLLLNSGNDAANVLARLGGGAAGAAGGVGAMNAEARRLGAYQTHAVTPSGLDGPGQFTSAYDLALITRACFEIPQFRRYIATERVKIPPQPPKDKRGFQIQNQNDLMSRYKGALGGKTGYTDLARHTYVGVAQRGGRRLVVTLLGAEAVPRRGWQQGATLLDWGFAQPRDASVGRLVEPGEVPPPAPADRRSESVTSAGPTPGATRPGRSAAPGTTTVSMTDSMTGAAMVLAVAAPLILLVALARRARRRTARRTR
jgi:D-alanyl-D-alanine carboxypeptidase (penicillin-binding protein 5/6)